MTITNEILKEFCDFLREQERSERTIEKYIRDVRRFSEYVGSEEPDTRLTS